MKKKTREQELIEQYPDLFPEGFGLQCSEGWIELVRFVCVYFQGLLDNTNEVTKIKFTQIKEKFGFLRIYFDHTTSAKSKKDKNELYHKLYDFIWTIENISGLVCEDCGKIKNKNFNVETKKPRNYWIRTLCDKCFEKEKNRDKC